MLFITKTKKHNDVTDRTCAVYDENETGQRQDESYRSDLPQKRIWTVMTRKDNDVTGRTSIISTKHYTELSGPIK